MTVQAPARTDDLNQVKIRSHDGPDPGLSDPATADTGDVSVFFRDLKPRLIEFIGRAEIVVGCVAWLTEPEILAALGAVPHGVSVIVQKEDFLRPDANNRRGWKARLRGQYEALPYPPSRYEMPGTIHDMSCCSDPTIQPVRCAGMGRNGETHPLMHHKFLVACHMEIRMEDRYGNGDDEDGGFGDPVAVAVPVPVPFSVWTGSANLTANSVRSLENGLVIESERIAQAYYDEWAQVAAISEPLDWTSEWVAPEWRIGS